MIKGVIKYNSSVLCHNDGYIDKILEYSVSAVEHSYILRYIIFQTELVHFIQLDNHENRFIDILILYIFNFIIGFESLYFETNVHVKSRF